MGTILNMRSQVMQIFSEHPSPLCAHWFSTKSKLSRLLNCKAQLIRCLQSRVAFVLLLLLNQLATKQIRPSVLYLTFSSGFLVTSCLLKIMNSDWKRTSWRLSLTAFRVSAINRPKTWDSRKTWNLKSKSFNKIWRKKTNQASWKNSWFSLYSKVMPNYSIRSSGTNSTSKTLSKHRQKCEITCFRSSLILSLSLFWMRSVCVKLFRMTSKSNQVSLRQIS